jgi:7-carboxy-7-deazaguanine synthase
VADPLLISELFYSIQGESTRAGLPCAFIRLSGCNLRCSYCDSSYTWNETGQKMNIDQVAAWLDDYPGVMVEITGGEPLLQEGVYPLMELLLADGREVLLETSGSLDIARVPAEVGIILDLKSPGSGMDGHNKWPNLETLRNRKKSGSNDEIKFVLSSVRDFTWASRIVNERRLAELVPVLFSPVTDLLPPELLAGLILNEQLPVRLQLQLHTQIWPDIKRGV